MQAIVKAGPVRIAISTGGVAPRVGKTLKLALEPSLDAKFARFIDCLATQKRRGRARMPSAAERRERDDRGRRRLRRRRSTSYPQWFEDELRRALAPRVGDGGAA